MRCYRLYSHFSLSLFLSWFVSFLLFFYSLTNVKRYIIEGFPREANTCNLSESLGWAKQQNWQLKTGRSVWDIFSTSNKHHFNLQSCNHIFLLKWISQNLILYFFRKFILFCRVRGHIFIFQHLWVSIHEKSISGEAEFWGSSYPLAPLSFCETYVLGPNSGDALPVP